MPRRKVLVIGTLLCSVLLAANAAFSAAWASEITSSTQNLNIGRAGAAFFFLFGVAYAFTVSVLPFVIFDKHHVLTINRLSKYTPLQSLYPAECLETTTRAKGVSMKIFIISCTSFINLFCTPIAYGAIGWKYILVFVFWDAFEAVVWYFLCVETVGFTLEELQEIFDAPNPPAASQRKKKVVEVTLHHLQNSHLNLNSGCDQGDRRCARSRGIVSAELPTAS